MYSLINKSVSWGVDAGTTKAAVYTWSPPLPDVPPVATPDTENVISPTSEDGASHSTIHSPETVLVLC